MQFHEALRQLDHCLRNRMQAYHSPALALALTNPDKLISISTFGYADMEGKRLVEPTHLFALGSIGKVFTAVAVLQANEKKLIDLRSPVQEYLPWFSVKSNFSPATIHHLLSHSSGLPQGTEFSPDSVSEIYSLRDIEVGFPPGTHFWYSDAGYKILGLILEKVTGKPYAEVIRECILEPLEMDHTVAVTEHRSRPQMAIGYRYLYDDRPSHATHPLVPAGWVETNSGDGCILSTIEDMAKFARMLLNEGQGPRGRVLSETSYRKMITSMIDDEGEAYGYGLYLFDDDGYRHAGHGGDIPGYESYLWMDLDNKLGAVMLMTTPPTPQASFLALEYLRSAYLGFPVPAAMDAPDFTHIADPVEYSGIYQSGSKSLTFEADGHHLLLSWKNERIILEERDNDRFYADHPDWNIFLFQFFRSHEGNICECAYGPDWYIGQGYDGPRSFDVPAEWAAYTGHYRSHNPWNTNFRIFTRKGQLLLCQPDGDEEILVQMSEDSFRLGEDDYIPERIIFDQFVEGQSLRATLSGCPYYRFFTL